jgi:hypothetical protein
MSPKAPSFTAYDFLGYLVPGLALVGIVDMSLLHSQSPAGFSWEMIITRYGALKWTGLFPLFFLGYLLGHLIGFASSILIEKSALWRHGDPAKFLCHGHSEGYLAVGGEVPLFSKILRMITFVLVWPISVADWIFTSIIPVAKNYIRPFDPMVKEAVGSAVADLWIKLGLSMEHTDDPPWTHDIERLALHCAIESAPVHLSMMRNYVVLYGFLRSICLLFVVSCWIILFHAIYAYQNLLIWASLLGFVSLAFLTYAAFLKFWIRYHKDSLMAFVAAFALSGGMPALHKSQES